MPAGSAPTGLDGGPHVDHVCWVYDDVDAFAAGARRYLADGLARGERLLCIGNTVVAAVRSDGPDLPGAEELLARGALEIVDVAAAYERGGAVRPDEQLAFYESATGRALADGYTGLCVVADATDLAADASLRTGLLEWEHLADRFIGSGSGMTALCAYDGTRIDETTATDLASVHPAVSGAVDPPFRIWFDSDRITLAGEVDLLSADRLSRVLASSPADGPVVALDLARVEFMDVAGCRALARWAAELHRRGSRLVLLGTSRLFRRMWTVLDFAGATGTRIEEERSVEPPVLPALVAGACPSDLVPPSR